MINISLPDGSVRKFDKPVSGADIAASIGPGLAKAALAVKVDGKMKDLSTVVDHDARIGIVTSRDPEALELLRHDAAHVLAQAVQELFPGTQVTIGPVIEDGFFYDFARKEPFSTEDFAKIEKRNEGDRRPRPADQARGLGAGRGSSSTSVDHGEDYKARHRPTIIPPGEAITLYAHGDWLDLCLRPAPALDGQAGKAFKLTKLAGAYWRGDHANALLQRMYGTACSPTRTSRPISSASRKPRSATTARSAASSTSSTCRKRRKGMVFWHPKGWTLWRTVESYLRRRLEAAGYVEVSTPQVLDRKLWEQSGHWEKYRENMFSRDEDGLRSSSPTRSALRAQADELPGPRADLQARASEPIATCRCAWPSSARATATSRRARCTA